MLTPQMNHTDELVKSLNSVFFESALTIAQTCKRIVARQFGLRESMIEKLLKEDRTELLFRLHNVGLPLVEPHTSLPQLLKTSASVSLFEDHKDYVLSFRQITFSYLYAVHIASLYDECRARFLFGFSNDEILLAKSITPEQLWNVTHSLTSLPIRLSPKFRDAIMEDSDSKTNFMVFVSANPFNIKESIFGEELEEDYP